METISVKAMGRLAGLAYLGVVLAGLYSLAYVPSQLITLSDPAKTLEAIQGADLLFRTGVAAGFACYIFFLILPFLLYPIVAPHGRISAALMVGFAAVSVPLSMMALTNQFGIVRLLESPPEGMDAAALAGQIDFYIRAYVREISAATIFWGLWLIPLGVLVIRSAVIPRILGVFLVAGGVGYVLSFFGPVLYAGYNDTLLADYDTLASSIGEIGTCLWLLVMGAKDRRPA